MRRPSDAFYSSLHWICMGIIAALMFHALVTARFITTAHGTAFRLIIAAMIALNVLWWSIADQRYARHISARTISGVLRIFTFVFSFLMMLPLFYMLWLGHVPQLLLSPLWYAAAITLWNLGLVVIMPPAALMRLMVLGVVRLVRRTHTIPESQVDLGRRALL